MRFDTVLEVGTVGEIFRKCIVQSGEDKSRGTSVASIIDIGSFRYFDKDRLEANRTAIVDMLKQLPKGFQSKDGASFGESNIDHRGIEWIGPNSVLIQEQLIQMGVAIGNVSVSDVRNWGGSPRHGGPTVKIHKIT